MKELHLTVTAEIENRLAKVKVVTGEFVFPFEGPVSYEGEHAIFTARVIYFSASKTATYELTKQVIRETGVETVSESVGSLIPDIESISATVEKATKQRFPLVWPSLLNQLRNLFQ